MSKRFLISVAAAALLAGTGFANAQGTGMSKESPAAGGGAATQHSAPSGGAMDRDSGSTKGDTGMKGAESTKGAPDKAAPSTKGAQDNTQKSKSMSSENEGARDKAGVSKDMKAESHDKAGASKDMKADSAKPGAEKDMKAEGRSGTTSTEKSATDTKSMEKSQTTGNAATTATAAPPAEKRTQITTAIKSERIEETTNVNFNIAVGSTIPATVRFHPLPPRIVEIYPEWRGYEVVFVKGRYIIVRPQTHEIVYIIEG